MSATPPRQRSLLAKHWLRYGLLAVLVVTYALLWISVGDPLGALLSLIVLGLAAALVALVPTYFIVNAPALVSGVSLEAAQQAVQAGAAPPRKARRGKAEP